MFGFWKKKGGEVPEEQQWQRSAEQRAKERQQAAEIPQALHTLGQDFLPEELEILADYIVEGKDIRSNEKIAKHADWTDSFLPKYDSITKDNVMDILKEETGIVFTHVLEDAGVYKCTPEGRAAFETFIASVK